ncbi:BgTH12-02993 [Blumeria graminis f. sp. triticale]|uniref:BgTH12-02993 n=1 Tax=Blumeria graminis f. sp. triticale TaxID=1689686 RepID=A0A9W4D3B3_BLUGR|nr:BgTH12-02993 [Blumeria graminis f. sp. triticale]
MIVRNAARFQPLCHTTLLLVNATSLGLSPYRHHWFQNEKSWLTFAFGLFSSSWQSVVAGKGSIVIQ